MFAYRSWAWNGFPINVDDKNVDDNFDAFCHKHNCCVIFYIILETLLCNFDIRCQFWSNQVRIFFLALIDSIVIKCWLTSRREIILKIRRTKIRSTITYVVNWTIGFWKEGIVKKYFKIQKNFCTQAILNLQSLLNRLVKKFFENSNF